LSDTNATSWAFPLIVQWTNNYYRVGKATIWVCYQCGEMFDGEICTLFTGQCYKCYPRPDEMTGEPFVGLWEEE